MNKENRTTVLRAEAVKLARLILLADFAWLGEKVSAADRAELQKVFGKSRSGLLP
jgi:hypothetical protein